MSDNTFYGCIWLSVAAVVMTLIATVGGCTAYESKRIADAIDKGADPIDARCGIAGTTHSGGTICAMRAAREKTNVR